MKDSQGIPVGGGALTRKYWGGGEKISWGRKTLKKRQKSGLRKKKWGGQHAVYPTVNHRESQHKTE